MKLNVSDSLALSVRFLELRSVTFGGSGAGKTTGARVLFEEAIAAGVVAGAIDLKSDWWGLQSTVDGKGKGIPVVIFGGERADVPLEENGGAALAEIVADLRQPFIVDLEQLSKGKQLRFLAAFFERLYDVNRDPLVLFCDEVDRYAPQKPMSPEANLCLGAVEDIAKRGRKHGIFAKFITQRNASLNKNVSELCDVAIVYRTPGPRDQDAVEDWFATNATAEQRDLVMSSLSGMPTGTAVICSAHPHMKIFETVKLREPWTFDSSATPEIGKRSLRPKELAKPDLEILRVRMAETIERARENDPNEWKKERRVLRAKIADLEKRLETPAVPVPQIIEKPVLTDPQLAELREFGDAGRKIANDIGAAAARILEAYEKVTSKAVIGHAIQPTRRPAMLQPASRPTTPASGVVSGIGAPQQRIIDTLHLLAVLGIEISRDALAAWYGVHPNNKTFANNLSALRTAGMIEGLTLTAEGFRHARSVPIPSQEDLRARILAPLTEPQRRIMHVLLEHDESLTRDDLAGRLGVHPNNKTFANNLSALRTRQLITRGSPIKAGRVLYMEER